MLKQAITGPVAYLGPSGTFTEMALQQVVPGVKHLAQPSVIAALNAVRAGSVEAAVVPIENSVEGGVSAAMDALSGGEPLVIRREVVVPVSFVLVARKGVELEDITAVSTHPHGHAQCRNWLTENLPNAVFVPGMSTAYAAEQLANGVGDYQAALCSPLAATRYDLSILADDVADNPNAVTRFVLVSKPVAPEAPTGYDKTSLVAYQPSDFPGGLLMLLDQFASRSINLVRIESRPTGDALGQYCFQIDAEGHIAEARMSEALKGLYRNCVQVKFLGSYPSAARRRVQVKPGTTDIDFERATTWVESLLKG